MMTILWRFLLPRRLPLPYPRNCVQSKEHEIFEIVTFYIPPFKIYICIHTVTFDLLYTALFQISLFNLQFLQRLFCLKFNIEFANLNLITLNIH